MSYRYDKEKKRKRIIYTSLVIFLIIAIFTPVYSFLYDVLEKPFTSAYQNTEDLKQNSNNFLSTWYTKKKLVEEVDILEKKIALLEVDNLRIKYLEDLLEKDKTISSLDKEVVMSSVLKKNSEGIITIVGGENLGFSEGGVVVNYDGSIIGAISEVFTKTSFVNLFTKDLVKTNGILFPQDISVEITGNGNALVSEVHRDVELSIGDLVYSQGQHDLIIGKVSAIDFDPRDPSKKVFIKPIHDVQSLQNIGVIKTTTE